MRYKVCITYSFNRLGPSGIVHAPPALIFRNYTFISWTIFMCSVCISEQTATFAVYDINLLVFIPEAVSVYCAVRTEFLYIIQFKSTLQRVTECSKAIHLIYMFMYTFD